MTGEVKNSLFLVLLAVQDFSTSEHIFFQKAPLFNLSCTCIWENNCPTGIHTSTVPWRSLEHHHDNCKVGRSYSTCTSTVLSDDQSCQELSHVLSSEKHIVHEKIFPPRGKGRCSICCCTISARCPWRSRKTPELINAPPMRVKSLSTLRRLLQSFREGVTTMCKPGKGSNIWREALAAARQKLPGSLGWYLMTNRHWRIKPMDSCRKSLHTISTTSTSHHFSKFISPAQAHY